MIRKAQDINYFNEEEVNQETNMILEHGKREIHIQGWQWGLLAVVLLGPWVLDILSVFLAVSVSVNLAE